ncbi:MAG TPA: hypothetical protein VFR07_11130 [Mycobacteriales bacterium]|nr:hypothetical protein [Mycobacteriales bacterium]
MTTALLPADDRQPVQRTGPRWPYALTALLPLALSVAAAGRTAPVLAGAGLMAALVVLHNVLGAPPLDPCRLALTANTALLVAFPFARLPQDRTTSYAVVVSTLAVAGSALLRTAPRPAHAQVLLLWLFGLLAVTSAIAPDPGAVKVVVVAFAAGGASFLLATRLSAPGVVGIAETVLLLAAASSVLALVEPRAFPDHLWAPAQVRPDGTVVNLLNPLLAGVERSQGTLGHPLQLSLLLVVALALLLGVLPHLPAALRVGSGALLLVGLVASGSRSALLGALALVLVGYRRRRVDQLVTAGWTVLLLGALVARQVLSDAPVTSLLRSGSFLHRVSAYESFEKLTFGQPLPHVLFGNGFLSTGRVFDLGLLQDDGFAVVDNQLVLTLSQGGVVCLLLLLAVAGTALLHAGPALRPAVLTVLVALLVTDTLVSPPAACLTLLVLGLACRRPAEGA